MASNSWTENSQLRSQNETVTQMMPIRCQKFQTLKH
jgi:hypothetical protein